MGIFLSGTQPARSVTQGYGRADNTKQV